VLIAVSCEPWIESNTIHFLVTAISIVVTHEALRYGHLAFLRDRMNRLHIREWGGIIEALGLHE
jgi:hypothetical protein